MNLPAVRFEGLLLLILCLLFLPANPAGAQDNLKEVPPTNPQYELDRLNIAEGYALNLFASDPMIEKPIQMTWDERGRLWIVGSAIYPHLLPGQEPDDKIFILEDTDGDGEADKSTVFADGLLTPTGLLIGDGGAYVANSTELLHLRDLDGDGYAEDRRVVLRGFGADDTHHIIHSFRWGPDGMMYINQSIYIYSHIETPWGIRRLRQGGIWHFRPENMKLEVFARGFYNPWGHAFDAWGQSFVTDGAGYRGINHVFPGAAFEATYKAERILPGLNDDQPKHAGLAIVSGRHMPDSLQGHLITNDFRANRVNRFVLTDEDDGYVSTAASDLIWSDHIAFRPVDVSVGPDGALYLADWYNPIIQHGEVDFRDPRRDHIHGRIWRITAKDRPTVEIPDLPNASVEELLGMLDLPERWTRRQARRLLKEKGAEAVLPVLTRWLAGLSPDDARSEALRLEGLWLHQALDVVNTELLTDVLDASDYRVRAAAVRVLYHWIDRIESPEPLLADAIADEAMRVRREALSALAMMDTPAAAQIAMRALDAPMNEEVDYALWYALRALEPHWAGQLNENPNFFGPDLKARLFAWKAVHTPEAIGHLLALYLDDTLLDAQLPAAEAGEVLDLIVQYGEASDLTQILQLALTGETVNGMDRLEHLEALEEAISTFGKTPTGNTRDIAALLQEEDRDVQRLAIELAGLWKLADLADSVIEIGINTEDTELQRTAFTAAARMAPDQLYNLLAESNPAPLRIQAAAALVASSPEEATPQAIDMLNTLDEQADVRPLFGAIFRSNTSKRLLAESLQQNPIPAHFATVGLQNHRGNRLRDRELLAALRNSGGVDAQQPLNLNMNAWNRDRLELDVKSAGDPAAGEEIYRRQALACVQCHAIGGAGGQVGPDLSSIGANAPTDYIIESLIEPQNAVKDGYALTSITRTDGQVVTGILIRDTGSAMLLRNAADAVVTVPNNLIEKQEILPGSLMPAGLLASLNREEFLHLVSFLSRLGETGEFRLPAEQYVRNWYSAPLPASATPTADELEQLMMEPGQPLYSRVNGALQMSDLPASDAGSAALLWFYIEVESAGTLHLQVNSNLGLLFGVEGKILPIENNSISFSLPPGNHPVAVVLDRQERGDVPLFIELRQAEASARAQLVQRDSDD